MASLKAQFNVPSPLVQIHDPNAAQRGIEVWVKRDDLIHPQISGNKWRKLRYNIQYIQKHKINRIITFGGAYSNHLFATAAAGKIFGIETLGIVRGEELIGDNPTLQFCQRMGMHLVYISREDYRNKNSREFLDRLENNYPRSYIIPEGGANDLAVYGAREITQEITVDFDIICCSVGTGTTLAGIVQGLSAEQIAIGFSSLKGGAFLFDQVSHFIKEKARLRQFSIQTDYHFGGYAKTQPELLDFMQEFLWRHNIQLDQVYTGKLFYGIWDLIHQGYFKKGSRIVLVHSGGIQNETI
jgi:1-aminocyclopropane-1-carboxylate deaminase/D-cysteine desulfhydrase-like pyridoxal-dependent ACC family enzyme